jgi:hypothetical protein
MVGFPHCPASLSMYILQQSHSNQLLLGLSVRSFPRARSESTGRVRSAILGLSAWAVASGDFLEKRGAKRSRGSPVDMEKMGAENVQVSPYSWTETTDAWRKREGNDDQPSRIT